MNRVKFMSKKFIQIVINALLVLSILQFSGCSCNCGKISSENFVKGVITVVGNEPFTKLAIKTDDDKIYVLQCEKELHDDLWKKQGSVYYILYESLKKELGDSVITVEKAVPATKEAK